MSIGALGPYRLLDLRRDTLPDTGCLCTLQDSSLVIGVDLGTFRSFEPTLTGTEDRYTQPPESSARMDLKVGLTSRFPRLIRHRF
jgi:hypothetical protein